jgi:hydrogenase-4 component B
MMDGETLQILLFLVIGGYGGGALAGLLGVGRARWGKIGGAIGFGVAALSSLLGCALSVAVMLSGTTLDVDLPRVLPIGDLSLHLDSLSAFFLLVISVVGTFVSLYSPGYASRSVGPERAGLLAFLYNLFLLSMAGVVIAGDAVLFLILWEMMSLTTFFLIVFEKESPASRRAGFLYVIMTHAGTAFLVVMFLLLFVSAGSFSFSALHGAGAGIPDPARSIIFLCALIGFGTKAGLIPLHIWLPEAHPAAPTNVSALMSGVMIKTGIYGMVRVFFGFLGPGAEWWGILVLALAVTSSVLGVLYALMEHDLKRLLAFHSIENIGIILMGIGAAMLFSASGDKVLAALALLAGLYHVLNHAVFKGLLFLGAGSVVNATGTRNMEKLGGLVRRLPVTAALFLVGSVAISALPPLNGFVSEWLTFQALLQGFSIASLPVKIAIPLTVALLALTGALAAACFVKAFGITFLGLPRSDAAGTARESHWMMLGAMAGLAILCLLLGIAPSLVMNLLDPTVTLLAGAPATALAAAAGATLTIFKSPTASISPPALAVLGVLTILLPVGFGVLLGKRLRTRTSSVWACGMETVTPRMQYTATGFSKPLRLIFANVFRARHEIEVSDDSSPYFRSQIRYELKTESLFERYLYKPLNQGIMRSSLRLRRIQAGNIQSYLAYIFVTLILLLMFAR